MATTQGHAQRRGKSGTAKYGRKVNKCERYRLEGRREKNKARRLELRERKYERNRHRGKSHGENEEARKVS